MNWIKKHSSAASIRFQTECRSDYIYSLMFTKLKSINPLGMIEYSHGIHPVVRRTQNIQVPFGTTQPQSGFTSQFLSPAITNLVRSLTGFFSFITIPPRLKSGATLCRPYRDLWLLTFPKSVGNPYQLGFPCNFGKVKGGCFE